MEVTAKDQLEGDEALKINVVNEATGSRDQAKASIEELDCDPWDDLGNWPADADKYKGMQLSNSRMRNEINHREPRQVDEQDGVRHSARHVREALVERGRLYTYGPYFYTQDEDL